MDNVKEGKNHVESPLTSTEILQSSHAVVFALVRIGIFLLAYAFTISTSSNFRNLCFSVIILASSVLADSLTLIVTKKTNRIQNRLCYVFLGYLIILYLFVIVGAMGIIDYNSQIGYKYINIATSHTMFAIHLGKIWFYMAVFMLCAL